MTEYIYIDILSVVLAITTLFSFTLALLFSKEYRKKLEPDISVEEMLSLENRIRDFLLSNNLAESYTIDLIAQTQKIKITGEVDGLPSQAQISSPDKDGYRFVTFRTGLSDIEKLFDLAHECAHILNNHKTPAARPDGENKSYEDQIADYTAAALILPINKFYKTLISENYFDARRSERKKIIQKLCVIFGVNDILCVRRIKEVLLICNTEEGRLLVA